MVLIKIIPGKKVITEAMLFNFLSFLTHTAHTEKADDKAKKRRGQPQTPQTKNLPLSGPEN